MSGDSYSLDLTKTRKDFKDLIGQFQRIQHDNFYALYTKIIVLSGTDMQKVWPVLDPVSIVDPNNNWFEYTKYKALYDGQSCNIYGYLSGTDLMRDGRTLVEPIESAIKWLVLYYYTPEKMPDSDTFLDNYPKYLAEGSPLKEFPKFALWYEFLIKLADEPGSHIETTPLESVSERKREKLPCMVKTQTLKTDVCEASISALDYLLGKAEHRFRRTVLEHKQAQIPAEAGKPASGGKIGNNKTAVLGTTKPKVDAMRDKVFISYSHKDKRWLDDLQTHLKPYMRSGSITVWSDKQIAPGSKWLPKIEEALAYTKVAVLLVTPYFLASDFIHEKELCPLLKKAENGNVSIIWIPVRACSYKETPLKDYQAVGNPDKPLANMKAERDKAWVRICEEIKKAVSR